MQITNFDGICRISPMEIEKRSFEIIQEEAGDRLPEGPAGTVMKRVIHTTADFDYRETLKSSPGAVEAGLAALKKGAVIVTDTNMALAGINKRALAGCSSAAVCYMADERTAGLAKELGTTRAAVSVDLAAELEGPVVYAVGNAPTALLRLADLIEQNRFRPDLVIGVPVGFVNVVEAKERIMQSGIQYIVAAGRKGGSTVAAAICNALLYMLEESRRQEAVWRSF